MTSKEKITKIYEVMADITLSRLEKIKKAEVIICEDELRMVSATLNMYLTIADNPQPDLFQDSPYESVKRAFEETVHQN